MDFRLKVFTVVARHLSFTKAARELEVSQPAITKHIQELESIYALQLFDRTGGKITLTEQGASFLKYAHNVLDSYSNLSNEVDIMNLKFGEEVKLGVEKGIFQHLVPLVVSPFIARRKDVRLLIVSDDSARIEHDVAFGSIDLGIVQNYTCSSENICESFSESGFKFLKNKNERNDNAENFITFAQKLLALK